MYLSRPEALPAYLAGMETLVERRFFVKHTDFFGNEVPVYRVPRRLYDRIRQSDLARRYAHTRLAESLKPLLRRIFN